MSHNQIVPAVITASLVLMWSVQLLAQETSARAEIEVPATEWVATNIYVLQGDMLTIRSSGNWSNAGGPDLTSPQGWGPYPGTEVADANIAALVGQIGDVKFLVGQSYVMPAPATGRLLLAINDVPGSFDDNQGSVTSTIFYIPRTEPPELVEVPPLIGQSGESAEKFLDDLQLFPAYQGEDLSTLSQGLVTRTEPEAGTSVERQTMVNYWTASGSDIVPRVIQLTPEEAGAMLENAGFSLGVQEFRVNDASIGVIFDQSPEADSLQPVGTAITIVVGIAGPVEVPVLVGETAETSERLLGQLQLFAVYRGEEISSLTQGIVTRTEPEGGASVERQTTVVYWTSSGSNIVPAVTQLTLEQAIDELERAGFRPITERTEIVDADRERVLDQFPEADSLQPAGTEITITVGIPKGFDPTPWLLAGAAALLIGGYSLHKWKEYERLKRTVRLLEIHPLLDKRNLECGDNTLPMAGPAVHLQRHMEMGEVHHDGPLPIIKQEIRSD